MNIGIGDQKSSIIVDNKMVASAVATTKAPVATNKKITPTTKKILIPITTKAATRTTIKAVTTTAKKSAIITTNKAITRGTTKKPGMTTSTAAPLIERRILLRGFQIPDSDETTTITTMTLPAIQTTRTTEIPVTTLKYDILNNKTNLEVSQSISGVPANVTKRRKWRRRTTTRKTRRNIHSHNWYSGRD